MTAALNREARKYLAQIGAKGGQAGKGTALRSELNRKASRIRWERWRKLNPKKKAKPK